MCILYMLLHNCVARNVNWTDLASLFFFLPFLLFLSFLPLELGPLTIQLKCWGSAVSSLSWFRGGAPVKIKLGARRIIAVKYEIW